MSVSGSVGIVEFSWISQFDLRNSGIFILFLLKASLGAKRVLYSDNWVVVQLNSFCFHLYLWKIPILTNIFKLGWNHQLDKFGEPWKVQEELHLD